MIHLPKRKSIRLKNYDYSLPGWYYVTICTQNRGLLFGTVSVPAVGVDPRVDPNDPLVGAGQRVRPLIDPNDPRFNPNDAGKMVNEWWLKIPQRFKNVQLDEYQIMPNHLHGIIVIVNGQTHGQNGQTHGSAPTDAGAGTGMGLRLPKIIQWFKTMTTNAYIRGVKNYNWTLFNKRLWQRNYYENIIRTQNDLDKIRKYIKNNPQIWDRDRNNPKNYKK
jgi:putative transposase